MRILLTRLDRVGDLVLSTPAIATVRASFPQAHITFVASAYNRVVVERNTDIDELHALPRDVKPARFGETFRGRTDLAIALAPRAEDFSLVAATRAASRVGYTYQRRYLARLTARRFLTKLGISDADPELSERDPARVIKHEVDQLLDVVALAGAVNRVDRLRVDLTDADRAAVASLPSDPLVFHLGARWFAGGSTLQNTIDTIAELRATFGLPVVVTYGGECASEAAMVERAGVADAVAGGMPFHQWAATFERARAVVTVDTGATHVASAMRRPSVVVFEHRYFRLSSQEWAPYGVPYALVRKPADETEASLSTLRSDVARGVAAMIER